VIAEQEQLPTQNKATNQNDTSMLRRSMILSSNKGGEEGSKDFLMSFLNSEECRSSYLDGIAESITELLQENDDETIIAQYCSAVQRQKILDAEKMMEQDVLAYYKNSGADKSDNLTCQLALKIMLLESKSQILDALGSTRACEDEIARELEVLHKETHDGRSLWLCHDYCEENDDDRVEAPTFGNGGGGDDGKKKKKKKKEIGEDDDKRRSSTGSNTGTSSAGAVIEEIPPPRNHYTKEVHLEDRNVIIVYTILEWE